ncbi:hypothetical protein [Paenibacillus segetis]|uniref:Uncharacterized protein n=1 Tax=Paenibacillus segetis TaxID=1325360 RepID=A0ABQ1YR72_9BACL|nr:hypothetical protein [Paenibacillus segetis]GGH35367.1 hypothetical protein GCM10008013_41630 [Paenibacillus segetis]
MIAGHLQEKKDLFYIVLNCKNEEGKRKPKWIPTGLPVKGNKKRAEAMLIEMRRTFKTTVEKEKEHRFVQETQKKRHLQKNLIKILYSLTLC